MKEISELPNTRRVVTGHDSSGNSIFEADEWLRPLNPAPLVGSQSDGPKIVPLGVTLLHRTRGFPARIQGTTEELGPENLRRGQGESGIVCQIVDLPPTPKGKAPYLHRNRSLDYGVVLKGTMQIVLDDGVEKTLHEGDTYVQKGTMHAWKNISGSYCRFLTVVVPSQAVIVADTGEVLTATKIPGLSD